RQRKRKKDRVARRYVRDGNALGHLRRRTVLGDREIIGGERARSESAQVDWDDAMLPRAKKLGHTRRRLEFDPVALSVIERQGIAVSGRRSRVPRATRCHVRRKKAPAAAPTRSSRTESRAGLRNDPACGRRQTRPARPPPGTSKERRWPGSV